MKMNRPKKCPICQSKRISVYGLRFYCKKCGYINEDMAQREKRKTKINQNQ